MGEDLRSSGEGLRGFKSHPPHQYVEIAGGFTKGDMPCQFQFFLFRKSLCPLKSQTNSNPASTRVQASPSVLATLETYSI